MLAVFKSINSLLFTLIATGITGVYDPDGDTLVSLLAENAKGDLNISSLFSSVTTTTAPSRRRLLWEDNGNGTTGRRLLATTDTSNLAGILNPSICLKYGETIMFTVDNDNYPVYYR